MDKVDRWRWVFLALLKLFAVRTIKCWARHHECTQDFNWWGGGGILGTMDLFGSGGLFWVKAAFFIMHDCSNVCRRFPQISFIGLASSEAMVHFTSLELRWSSCTYLMHISHAHISCTYLMHISHAHISCTYLMHISHAHISHPSKTCPIP